MEIWHTVLNIAILCQMVILPPGVLPANHDQSTVIVETNMAGGRVPNEGLVEIYSGGQWFNLCAVEDNQTKIIAEYICEWSTFNIYTSNVFDAPRKPTTIKLTGCQKTNRGELSCKTDVSNDSNVVSLCCIDKSDTRHVCSANWSTVFRLKPHHFLMKPDITDFQTYRFNDAEDRNKSLSWTKYAFEVVNYGCNDDHNNDIEKNIVVNDSLIACANEYLDKTLLTGEDVVKEMDCYCTNKSYSYTVKLVSEQNSQTILCVAGSVTNGKPKLEAVVCSKYLPSFVVTKQDGVTTISPEHETMEEKSAKVVILIVVTIVITLVSFCVMYKCITYRNRETPVINSMNNDTYYRNEERKGEEDEEYTLINEMEMNSSSVKQSRPPLPERRNDQDISAADEYSLPIDSLPTAETDSQSLYTKTYDDPIRMKLRRSTSNKSKHNSRTKSNDLSDSKLVSNTKQDLDTDHESDADIPKDETVKESSDEVCICSKDHLDVS